MYWWVWRYQEKRRATTTSINQSRDSWGSSVQTLQFTRVSLWNILSLILLLTNSRFVSLVATWQVAWTNEKYTQSLVWGRNYFIRSSDLIVRTRKQTLRLGCGGTLLFLQWLAATCKGQKKSEIKLMRQHPFSLAIRIPNLLKLTMTKGMHTKGSWQINAMW